MEKYDREFWEWVNRNEGTDPLKLRLKHHGQSEAIDAAVTHLECVRKAGNKFICRYGESWKPALMLSPLSVEQATSANVAWIHGIIVNSAATAPFRALDMTCGMGMDSAMLSTNPGSRLTTLDLNPVVAEMARYNFSSRENVEVIEGDSVDYLKQADEKFDIILIDPARRGDAGQRVYNIHDCTPDVCMLMPTLKEHARHIFIKLSPMLDVTQTLRDIPEATCIHIIDDNGECREVFIEIDTEATGQTVIKAWHGTECFTFTPEEEASAEDTPCPVPAVGEFIYEPSPALMKAAPFRLLGSRHGMTKLHRSTHLYLGDTPDDRFPGTGYRIVEIIPFSSSEIKRFAKKYPVIDVATRNFGIDTDTLRRRLKVKQGGRLRLMATTLGDSERYMLILERVEKDRD